MIRRLALVGVVVACKREGTSHDTAVSTTRIVEVAQVTLTPRVLLTGELAAGVTTDLNVPKTDSWQLTIRWMADDGTHVKAGDRAVEFDNSAFTTGLEQKKIAATEARSQFATSRDLTAMALANKRAEVEQARIAVDRAKLKASIPADLISQRAAHENQLDMVRSEVALAKVNDELAAEVQAVALEAKVKQIELDKATRAVEDAQRTIENLVVKAPRDGLIQIGDHPWEGRRFQLGDTVQPGFTILTMPDFSQPMIVMAELSDVDDGRVTTAMAGTCTLDAYPREPLPCSVATVAPVARTKHPSSLRRAFGVTMKLDKTDRERMRPGMSVKIALAGPPASGLAAPRGAIVLGDKPGVAQVRLADGGSRPVTLGVCDAGRCIVTQGLAAGDRLREGAP